MSAAVWFSSRCSTKKDAKKKKQPSSFSSPPNEWDQVSRVSCQQSREGGGTDAGVEREEAEVGLWAALVLRVSQSGCQAVGRSLRG